MKLKLFLLLIFTILLFRFSIAQIYYADSKNGDDLNKGNINNLFKTLSKK